MGSTRRVYLWALCCLFTILSTDLALAVHPTIFTLQQKMEQIASLRASIAEKAEQGKSIRQQFKEQMEAIAQEIKDEQEWMETKSYEEAIQCARIDYDLRLLQRYDGYLSEIDRRLNYYQTLDVQLAYLFQRAEDDMKIIETLNDMDIAALMIRIDRVLDEYLPEADKPLIRAKHLRLPPHEDVWNEIVKRY